MIELCIGDEVISTGKAENYRIAKKRAAQKALDKFMKENDEKEKIPAKRRRLSNGKASKEPSSN